MQVMARAENTVFLRVEVKDTNLEIFSVYAFTAKKISGSQGNSRDHTRTAAQVKSHGKTRNVTTDCVKLIGMP